MEILQNEKLRVTIEPDDVSASIELIDTGLKWKFQPTRFCGSQSGVFTGALGLGSSVLSIGTSRLQIQSPAKV